jgi:NAD(P)-dependent dehydrogenase (short-subunit alcohol dehydrogenase family)
LTNIAVGVSGRSNINARGTLLVITYASRSMIRLGNGGSIVNVSSQASLVEQPALTPERIADVASAMAEASRATTDRGTGSSIPVANFACRSPTSWAGLHAFASKKLAGYVNLKLQAS